MLRRGLVLLLVLGTLFYATVPAHAQQTSVKYFYETGHTVQDEFLAFYLSSPDPLLVYGLPITEAFIDPLQNIKMQYFQRARFELNPHTPAGKRVQLSTLGSLTYQVSQVQDLNLPTNTPQCRRYHQYAVCYAFLAFFDAHGGLAQFGYPISNYSNEGDQYVQYFERARFEFHPELSDDIWVRLTDIGYIQFYQSNRDPILLQSLKDFRPSNNQVTRLLVKAYVAKAVLSPTTPQSLTVIVLDQSHQAVQGALVAVSFVFLDGNVVTNDLPMTDALGLSRLDEIQVSHQNANQRVLVKVTVTFGDLRGAAITWYQVWW